MYRIVKRRNQPSNVITVRGKNIEFVTYEDKPVPIRKITLTDKNRLFVTTDYGKTEICDGLPVSKIVCMEKVTI